MLCAIALCLISCGSSGKFVSPKFHFRHPDLQHHHRHSASAAVAPPSFAFCMHVQNSSKPISPEPSASTSLNTSRRATPRSGSGPRALKISFSSLTKTAPLPSLSKTENAFLYEAIISSEIAGGVPPARALSPRARMALPRVRAQSLRAHSPRAQSPRLWAPPPRAQAEPSWAPLWLCVPLLCWGMLRSILVSGDVYSREGKVDDQWQVVRRARDRRQQMRIRLCDRRIRHWPPGML